MLLLCMQHIYLTNWARNKNVGGSLETKLTWAIQISQNTWNRSRSQQSARLTPAMLQGGRLEAFENSYFLASPFPSESEGFIRFLTLTAEPLQRKQHFPFQNNKLNTLGIHPQAPGCHSWNGSCILGMANRRIQVRGGKERLYKNIGGGWG